MTGAFERHGDAIRLRLRTDEVSVLREVHGALRAVLTGTDHDDPVVARLFPPAVIGDDETDQDVRALIHDDLLTARLDGLDAVAAIMDRMTPDGKTLVTDLTDDEPMLVLGVLNDLRLALGARVGVEVFGRDVLLEDDRAVVLLALMDHIAGWLEDLLDIIDPASLSFYDDQEA